MNFEISPLGDMAIQISFGMTIDEATNGRIRRFINKLENTKIEGLIEWVPAYTTITIYYQPDLIDFETLITELERINHSPPKMGHICPIVFEIPVCYEGELGPDLAFVAEYHSMTEQEVINLHANREYLIYMMGFMPGFPYLGGLPEKLAVPRLEKPRRNVMPGAVGIGGDQTGIYPADAPSGWRIIGTTPVILFSPDKEEPFLFSSGHYIKFVPISKEKFLTIKQMGDAYEVNRFEKR